MIHDNGQGRKSIFDLQAIAITALALWLAVLMAYVWMVDTKVDAYDQKFEAIPEQKVYADALVWYAVQYSLYNDVYGRVGK
jgi:hypothetical protein